MAVIITYHPSKHVIWAEYLPPLLGEDFTKRFEETRAYYDQAEFDLIAVSDFSHIKKLPPNALISAISASRLKHPKQNCTIFITSGPIQHKLMELYISITRRSDIVICATPQEAWEKVDKILASTT